MRGAAFTAVPGLVDFRSTGAQSYLQLSKGWATPFSSCDTRRFWHKWAPMLFWRSSRNSRRCCQPSMALRRAMKNDGTGTFGIIVGGVVAAIAVIFILTGGELGGKKTVEGDQDLPPVTTTDK